MSNSGQQAKPAIRTLAVGVMACALLGGCARNPELYVGPPVPPPAVETQIHRVLARIYVLRENYAKGFRVSSNWADLGQVPLIGIAVATAVVAVNNPKSGADTVAKLGIGAGAYAAGRSIFTPGGMPDLYRRGLKAVNCVLSEETVFAGAGAQETSDKLTVAARALARQIFELQATIDDDPISMTAAQVDPLKTARANARLAVLRATPVLGAAETEVGAFEAAPRVFDQTAYAISDAVIAKAVVRTEFDRNAFVANIKKLLPPEPKGVMPAAGGGRDAGALAQELENATGRVNTAAAATIAMTPAVRFSDRLFEVKKCPTLI